MDRYCQQCGERTRPGRFCSRCGAELPEIKTRPAPVHYTHKEKTLLSTTLIIALGVLVLVGGLFGSYRIYQWDGWGTVQSDTLSTMPIVGEQLVRSPEAGWAAAIVAVVSLSLSILLFSSAHIITSLADLRDQIESRDAKI